MEERDFLLSIKGKIEEYREAQDNLNRDDLYEGNDYRASGIKQSKKEYGSDEEKYWMEALEETKDYSTRKEMIEKIKNLRQQRVDELKKEISDEAANFKENFLRENEEKQNEAKNQRRKINSKIRRLRNQGIKLDDVKKNVSKNSKTYKAATEEQKEKIEKIKELSLAANEKGRELRKLRREKNDFLEKYNGIDLTTESGIDKLNGIANEMEDEQKASKSEEEMMKKRMIEEEQSKAETEAYKDQFAKVEEEARKLEEEIMKKRLEEKNGANVPPQKPTQGVPPTQENLSKDNVLTEEELEQREESLSRRDEIERGYTTRITIGRNATIQIGNNIINVKNKIVKDGVTLSLGDVKLSLESVGIDTEGNEGIRKLIENGTIDSVVINVLNTLSEEDRKKAITDYVNGFTKGSTPLKVTYDQDDLSKTSFLGRLFRREVNVAEKNRLLTRARSCVRYANLELKGEYKPDWKQEFISKWFTKEKPKEIAPTIPTEEEIAAAYTYNELLSKGELSKVKNHEGRTNIRKAYKLSDEQMMEFNSLYKEQERQNASKQQQEQVEPEELEH